jgi:hypothetical protein
LRNKLVRCIATLSLVAAGLLGVATPAQATSQAVQPARVALLILENESTIHTSSCLTGNGVNSKWNLPFLCGLIANSDGAGTNTNFSYGINTTGNYYSGAEYMSVAAAESSAPNYAAMVTGDDCHGNITDGHMNSGNSYTAGSTDNCGTDLFKQLDAASVPWTAYAEDFSNDAGNPVTCTNGSSDGVPYGAYTEYARRHNPSLFWTDVSGDCASGGVTSGSGIVDWPGYQASPLNDLRNDHRSACFSLTSNVCTSSTGMVNASGQFPFAGTTLPPFSVIVPNNCHDMHTKRDNGSSASPSCVDSGNVNGGWDAWGVYPNGGSTGDGNIGLSIQTCDTWPATGTDALGHSNHPCGAPQNQKVLASDTVLAQIVPNILNDLGQTGVLIITFDEGQGSAVTRDDAQNRVTTIVVPGTGATLNTTASPTADTDHAGLLAALIAAMHDQPGGSGIACSAIGGQGDGQTACSDAVAGNAFQDIAGHSNSVLPIKLLANTPTITSLSTSVGAVGDPVSITGTNFGFTSSVSFNGTAASFNTSLDGTTITTSVPPGATTGPITVTNPAGSVNSSTFSVAPTVTSFTNDHGNPGQAVTLSGLNFTSASAVSFNGTSASFAVTNDTTITTNVPVGATTGTISVTGPGGTGVSGASYSVISWTVIGQTKGGSSTPANVNTTASTATGDAVVAVLNNAGSGGVTTARPTGFAQTNEHNGAMMDVCASCAAITSGTNLSFTFTPAAAWTLTILDVKGLASSAVDTSAMGNYTSGATTPTTLDSGLDAANTAVSSELVIADLGELAGSTPTACSPACTGTFVTAGSFQAQGTSIGGLVLVAAPSAVGQYEAFATISPGAKARGVIVPLN